MTLGAPLYLLAGAMVAAATVVLHLIAARRRASTPLPTARFIPDARSASTALRPRPTDVALLLLRLAIVMLAALALARPRLAPARRSVERIVLVDVSRAVGDARELADSARVALRDARSVIAFDSSARTLAPRAVESLAARATIASGAPRGSLSAALIAALREGSRLRESADSLELVLVSPLAGEERDRATSAIRAEWPGRVTLVRVSAARPDTALAARVRVVRADSAASPLWIARAPIDTVAAVVAGDAALVAPMVRRWRVADPAHGGTRVVARWVDGEPAALERAEPGGCLRSIAFSPSAAGDAMLRPSFARLERALATSPCGGARDLSPMSDADVAMLRGAGGLAPTAAMAVGAERPSWLGALLLAIALALAAIELVVRRGARPGADGGTDDARGAARAEDAA